jgi:rare lipoprotein A
MVYAGGRVLVAALLASAIAACSTPPKPPPPVAVVPPPPPPAPPPPPPPPMASPQYKIGNPYQIAGVWYYPREEPDYDQTGIASWYGAQFHGRLTANGEVFDRTIISAAHPTLPMPVNVRVTNLDNGRSIVVRINDRGPFVRGRIIDLSEQGAELLGFKDRGLARVRVSFISRADLHGLGPAPISEYTPPEVATAVPAAPVSRIESGSLPPVAGATVAPPRTVAALPKPVEQAPIFVQQQIPDGKVTEVPVPSLTAMYVQAGAFSTPNPAGVVASRLNSLGAKVFRGTKDGQQIYRVRIGPLQTIEQADEMLLRVQELGHNDVQIVVEAQTS